MLATNLRKNKHILFRDLTNTKRAILYFRNFNQGAWIGVHYMTETSRYTNMFNQTIQFSNWMDGEPDEKDNKCTKVECVQMDTVGKWMDVCCTNSLPAICSKQLLRKFSQTYVHVHTQECSMIMF